MDAVYVEAIYLYQTQLSASIFLLAGFRPSLLSISVDKIPFFAFVHNKFCGGQLQYIHLSVFCELTYNIYHPIMMFLPQFFPNVLLYRKNYMIFAGNVRN